MNEMYLRLTDARNKGTVIRQIGRKFYGFDGEKWVRRGLSAGYFYPDAPEFDCYEEISKAEAAESIGEKAVNIAI